MNLQTDNRHQLRKSSVGVWGIVFFVVAAAAPLAATLGAGPFVFAFGGVGAPGMYLIASIVLLLFAVGFATMSRYVTSAGGFAAYVSKGLGRRAGHAAAGMALLAYCGMLFGIFAQFGIFASDLMISLFGLAVPWQVCILIGIVIVGIFGYLDIKVSAKVLGVLMILEVLILLVFDAVVIFSGGAQGINVDAFNPGNVFGPGIGVALLFAFACFVGFEATTIYGEEAKDPKRTVPRATYVAIAVIGVFYTLTTWAIGLAYGSQNVQAAALKDPVNFVFDMNTKYVGSWSTHIMQILVVTSVFAVLLAFHNTLSRYLFSLGRAEFLPKALGRTHRTHQSPSVASLALSTFTVVVLGVFMIAGADPFAIIYSWLVGIGTVGVLVLQASGAAAVIGFFLRRRGGNLWKTMIAPALGGVGLLIAIVLAVANFDQLSGATEGIATFLPWLVPIALVVGLVVGLARTRNGVSPDLGDVPEISDAADASLTDAQAAPLEER